MSNETIPKRSGRITEDFINLINRVLCGDFVPRNDNGVPTHKAGSLGLRGLEWLRAFISAGHWDMGDVTFHNSYGGTNPIGHGWMKCDGRVINQENYDAEHGAGSWTQYIGSTALDGKYLPDYVGKFAIMLDSVLANAFNGNSAFPTVGNTDNRATVTHYHRLFGSPFVIECPYQFYNKRGNGFQSMAPTYKDENVDGDYVALGLGIEDYPARNRIKAGSLTDPTVTEKKIQIIDITPDSIGTEYYMRIM